MNKLTWYLAKTVILSTLMIIVILLGIDAVVTFVVQTGNVGQGNFSVWTALEFTLWRLPSDLYLVLPVCGFLGVLFGMGALASRHELIVMRAAGMSMWRMSRGVWLGALVFVALGFALSTYISPITRHIAFYKASAMRGAQAVLVLADQSWIKSGDHFVLIGQALPDGYLESVNDFTVTDNKLSKITSAPEVKVEPDKWLLTNPTVTTLSPNKVTTTVHKQLQQPALLTPKLLHILALSPQNMTVTSLMTYIHYRVKNKLDANPYKLQFWNRIFQPLIILILMLLALPVVFQPMRSSGVGWRLMTGFSVGFGFYLVSQFFSTFSVIFNLQPFLGAALPTIVFTFLLVILLWRMN